ncbi:tyrosine-protein kinase family protein [Lactococcus cremoris]|nr:tyrosine-protein kinase family protein [Lactococcus cremoris]
MCNLPYKQGESAAQLAREYGIGYSTVSANLATSWAQSGKKTLLIDADIRRSIAHVTFALNNNEGLSTLLAKNGEP